MCASGISVVARRKGISRRPNPVASANWQADMEWQLGGRGISIAGRLMPMM